MLFDYLKAITTGKNQSLVLDEYIPFLITRWLSFGDVNVVQALNETVNSLGNLEKDKHYKLLLTLHPKKKNQPRFNYIKKTKQERDSEEEKKCLMVAQSQELSIREIKNYQQQVEYYKALE